MAENKKFYWLKLKEDFFDDKYIKALRKLPDGEAIVIVYLKMQLKSLKTDGFIQYDRLLPSQEEELALLLDEDLNVVRLALSALTNMKLVENWDNETLYMSAMQHLIGSETATAERVRKHREKIKLLEPPKNEAKTNAERQRAFRAKKACEEKQHIPFIEDYLNSKRYGGNYYIVMKRDKFKCSICGSIENLCVHHIDGFDEFKPQNNNENKLLTMCRCCHRQTHEGAKIPDDILESIDYFVEDNGSNVFCNTKETNCNIEIDIEKDIEIEKRYRDRKKEAEKFPPELDLDNLSPASLPYNEIIDYLNSKTNTNFRASSKKTQTLIKARFNEGFSFEDFKKVIDTKVAEWKNNPKMQQYLRPETLFGTKFESYLNQHSTIPKVASWYDEYLEKEKEKLTQTKETNESLEDLEVFFGKKNVGKKCTRI